MTQALDNTIEELFDAGEIDAILEKSMQKTEMKLRGKSFAGMEQEDVQQEMLIKIYKSLNKYDESKSRIGTYIDFIIDNTLKDMYKKCGSEKNLANVNALEIEDSYSEEQEAEASFGIHYGLADAGYLETDIMLDMQRNVELNAREREIIRLHMEGYAHVEIAEKLGITKARISQLWKIIMQKLN